MRHLNNYREKLKSIMSYELIYIGSDILVKAIAFISLPLFLNVMNPEDFGEFSLYTTYISFFAIFFGLNVSSAIVRYYVEKKESAKYLATAIWIVVIGGSVCTALILSLNIFFGFLGISSRVLIVILISTLFTCLAGVCREIIRSEKNAILYGITSVLISVIATIIGLLLIYTIKDDLAFWRLISGCITIIIIGAILTIRLLYKGGIKGNLDTAKYLLSYSIPLIPYAFSTTILAHVNKLFLADIGLAEVGIFTFASSLAMIIYIIAIALNRSLQPNLFEALRENKGYMNHLKRNMGIFYFFYICFIFGTDILIWIFGNEEYLEASSAIPILIWGYGYFYLYSLYVNILYYYKNNYTISLFSIYSAGVAVLANFILIKPFGYMGASFATLISYYLLFLLGYFKVTRRLNVPIFNIRSLVVVQLMLSFPVLLKIFLF